MAIYTVCDGFCVDKFETRVPQMYSYNTSLGETLRELASLSSMGEPTVVLSSMELSKYTTKLASLTQDNLFKRGIDISWAEAEHYVKVKTCTHVWILCMAEVCKDYFSIQRIYTRFIVMRFGTAIWINKPNFSPFPVIGNHTILHDRWNKHQATSYDVLGPNNTSAEWRDMVDVLQSPWPGVCRRTVLTGTNIPELPLPNSRQYEGISAFQ